MKRIALIVLLCASALQAQTTYLQNIRNQTKAQLSQIVAGVTIPNKAFFEDRIFQLLGVNMGASIELHGLTPYDFSNFRIGMDSSSTRGRFYIVPTDSFVVSSLTPLNYPLKLTGTATQRPAASSLSWPPSTSGSVIASSSATSTVHLLNVGYAGIDVDALTLLGNNRTNGVGFYGYRGDGTATTQGDYSFSNSLSLFNGGDGVRYVSPDGNLIKDVDAFNNKGYGIKITSTYGNFLDGAYQSQPTTNGNVGIATRVFGGRLRWNTKGGVHSFQQSGNIIIGLESISDSTVNYFEEGKGTTSQSAELGSTNSRTVAIGNDFEFVLPPASFAGTNSRVSNLRLHNSRNGTFMNNYWGSVHTQGTYTTDSGTNTTTIQDTEIIQRPTNYYVGWRVDNTTRSVTDREITASSNSGASTILTLASAIAAQTSGDTYKLEKNPDRGVFADSLWSWLFINNTHADVADSPFVAKNFAYPFFLGSNVNLDPETDLDTLTATAGSTMLRYFSIAHDKLATGGNPQITTNGELTLEVNPAYGQGDSLNIRALDTAYGVRVEAAGVIDLQPIVTTDATTQGDVNFHRLVSNDIYPETRWYFDADTSGSTRRAWLSFQGASGQPNRITISGATDSTSIGIASATELSGNDQVARYMDVLASNNRPETNALLNNRVRFYAFQDKLWSYQDNGDTLNVTPYNANSTWNPGNLTAGTSDSVTVAVTNAAVGDVVAVGHSGITTTTANLHLFGHVVSAGNVRVFVRNESGGTYDIPSGTLKIRVWK